MCVCVCVCVCVFVCVNRNQESPLQHISVINEQTSPRSPEPSRATIRPVNMQLNMLLMSLLCLPSQEFKKESLSHGWPSFRDEEVSNETRRRISGFTGP